MAREEVLMDSFDGRRWKGTKRINSLLAVQSRAKAKGALGVVPGENWLFFDLQTRNFFPQLFNGQIWTGNP